MLILFNDFKRVDNVRANIKKGAGWLLGTGVLALATVKTAGLLSTVPAVGTYGSLRGFLKELKEGRAKDYAARGEVLVELKEQGVGVDGLLVDHVVRKLEKMANDYQHSKTPINSGDNLWRDPEYLQNLADDLGSH